MCLICEPTRNIDLDQASAFADQLVEMANHATTSLMISVGHRTGLFDTMSGLSAATSQDIADAAQLDERYVREWLASMTVSGIVCYDPVRKSYRLPPEHASFLTRAAGGDNLASLMQYVSVMGGVETEIVDCFRRGGGVPYSKYERFHDVMAEDSALVFDSILLDEVLPLAPGLVERLEQGVDVLDIGCGAGLAMANLATTFPNSRFHGIDVCSDVIERARELAVSRALDNLTFEVADAASFHEVCTYDVVTTFDSVHDQARPDVVLSAIRRCLRPGGIYLMQDVAGSSQLEKNLDHPLAPLFYGISCFHCMTVSLSAGGMGLGTMWGEELAQQMLAEADLPVESVHHLDGAPQHVYFVARVAA